MLRMALTENGSVIMGEWDGEKFVGGVAQDVTSEFHRIVVEAFAPPRGVSSRTVIITKNGSTEAFEIATTRYSEVKVLS